MPEGATKDLEKAQASTPLESTEHVSQHTVTIGGERIDYTAKAGRLVLHDGKEEPTAKVALFYTAYTRHGTHEQTNRPIIFCWNGGPGRSSAGPSLRRTRSGPTSPGGPTELPATATSPLTTAARASSTRAQ